MATLDCDLHNLTDFCVHSTGLQDQVKGSDDCYQHFYVLSRMTQLLIILHPQLEVVGSLPLTITVSPDLAKYGTGKA